MMAMSTRTVMRLLALALPVAACLDGCKSFDETRSNPCNPALNPVKLERVDQPAATLIAQGQARAVIVVPGSADDHAYYYAPYVPENGGELYKLGIAGMAAAELQRHLELCTGVKLPIITAEAELPGDKTLVLVGESAATRSFGIDAAGLPPEGFRVEVFPRGVAIVGTPPRAKAEGGLPYNGLYSTLFGAYDFLERFCGVRFYYPGPDGTVTPKLDTVSVPPVRYVDFPRYEKRQMIPWTTTDFPGGTPDFVIHALRYRSGGHGKFGANYSWCHTPWNLCAQPCPQAVGEDGKPGGAGHPLPCYGDPKTVQALLDAYDASLNQGDLKAWRTDNGGLWGLPNSGILPFSPPDQEACCACPLCRGLIDKQAPFHARSSRLMAQFLKRLAEGVKERWPDKTLFYLPYVNYTSAPDDLTLPGNVFAQVCLMYGNSLYSDPYIHQCTGEWIHSWRKITGRPVHAWVYPMWPAVPSLFPYQYPHQVQAFTRDFAGDVNGAFLNREEDSACLRGGVWASQMPTLYCWFRLMWNPDFDVDAALREQTELLYGPAAEPMAKVMALLTDSWERQDASKLKSLTTFKPFQPPFLTKEEFYGNVATPQVVQGLREALAAAVKAAPHGSVHRRRVDFLGDTLRLFFQEHEMFQKAAARKMPALTACRRPGGLALDGRLDKPFWEGVAAQAFIDAYPSLADRPEAETTVRAAYDDSGAIFGFRMEEPEMGKRVTGRKEVWQGDSLEVFLEFQPGRVYQIIIDSEGKVMDTFLGGAPPGREGSPQFKVFKGKDCWSVELLVPFKALDTAMKFDPARSWLANFVRNRVVEGKPVQRSRWSTTFTPSNFDRAAFGTLAFGGN